MKLAYIGIDLFYTALEALNNLGCEIAEIFTCKTDNETEFNIKVTEFAKKHEIPYTLNRITQKDIIRLKAEGCKAAVCAGYYYKIPVCTDFPIANIHPSLLPMGRGSWPMPDAILKGLPESGVTIHKIAEGFDTGDILLQRRFRLEKNENLDTFMKKVCGLIPDMMHELTEKFDELWRNALPQGEGEYVKAQTEEDWTVTPDMDYERVDLILRAFFGYECIYKTKNEKFRMICGRVVRCAENRNERFPVKGGYITAENVKRI